MRFSEIEGTIDASGSTESLVHQVSWPPATFSEKLHSISSVVLISGHGSAGSYIANLSDKVKSVIKINRAQDLSGTDLSILSRGRKQLLSTTRVKSSRMTVFLRLRSYLSRSSLTLSSLSSNPRFLLKFSS